MFCFSLDKMIVCPSNSSIIIIRTINPYVFVSKAVGRRKNKTTRVVKNSDLTIWRQHNLLISYHARFVAPAKIKNKEFFFERYWNICFCLIYNRHVNPLMNGLYAFLPFYRAKNVRFAQIRLQCALYLLEIARDSKFRSVVLSWGVGEIVSRFRVPLRNASVLV